MIRFEVLSPELQDELKRQVSPIIRTFTLGISGEMRRLMQLPKRGREYKRRTRTHIASAPGEAPAIDTSNLVNSIQVLFPNSIAGAISIGAEYAAYLEFVAARPFVRPAIDGTIRQFKQAGIIRSVQRSLS